jgi:TolA-binding protein
MINFRKIYYGMYEMKRTFILMALPLVLTACGGATQQAVTPPDVAKYQAMELSVKSNSDRILKLEKQLDSANSEINTLRTQNRQLADSYDGMVELFKEHRGLTMTLIQKMNLLAPQAEEETK